MHELSIIAGLFDTLQEKARTHKAREITSVKLIVGKLSGVVPDLLESAFEAYKKGTIAEKARLEIDEVPLKTRCRACGAAVRKEDFDIICAACGSKDLEILQGTEIVLERIELDSDEPESPGSS